MTEPTLDLHELQRAVSGGAAYRLRIALQNVQGVALNGPPAAPQGRLERIDEIVIEALRDDA